MLWIALHLPSLSLEAFAATLASASERSVEPPLALIDAHCIVDANPAARALGVEPGLKRATALALAPQLTLGRADPVRDAQALLPVAHAALAFTPDVAIEPADGPRLASRTVLLEVESSLRFFGGLPRLLQRLRAALAPLRHDLRIATAPTALAAALLARIHVESQCADLNATAAALDPVPAWLLPSGRPHREALEGMGLRTLADLRRVPRAGVARRFGAALLGELDRALGLEPDPREPIGLPPVFESRLELFARADTTEQVLHGASLLLARLVLWLGAQQAQVRCFTLTMQHETRRRGSGTPAATTLEVALAEPSRDRAHLIVLLRERLARLALPAPTLDLGLRADAIVHRAEPNRELFPTARSEREGLTQLIERLQARLGSDRVQRLQPIEDHRPECGHRVEAVAAGTCLRASPAPVEPRPRIRLRRLAGAGARPAAPPRNPADPSGQPRRPTPRPVWLLDEPEPLPERQSRPLLGGQPLQLLSGPERIEAGWWDDARAERDYFIAQTTDGALVWIYRARLPLGAGGQAHGWFMQGRFG